MTEPPRLVLAYRAILAEAERLGESRKSPSLGEESPTEVAQSKDGTDGRHV